MATPIDVLKQLDERIQSSVNRLQQLRRENDSLAQKLAESEKRLADAHAQARQFEQERKLHETERTEVRSRIEKILSRFDGIELG
ncbi:MAG TPA: cell division protein ZapB [Candidatus Binataceae bacterium]|nr:cell division protein ZapB [Candidatus Binataceae bacterium]